MENFTDFFFRRLNEDEDTPSLLSVQEGGRFYRILTKCEFSHGEHAPGVYFNLDPEKAWQFVNNRSGGGSAAAMMVLAAAKEDHLSLRIMRFLEGLGFRMRLADEEEDKTPPAQETAAEKTDRQLAKAIDLVAELKTSKEIMDKQLAQTTELLDAAKKIGNRGKRARDDEEATEDKRPTKRARRAFLFVGVTPDHEIDPTSVPLIWEPDTRDTDMANKAVRDAFQELYNTDDRAMACAVGHFSGNGTDRPPDAFLAVLPQLVDGIKLTSIYETGRISCPVDIRTWIPALDTGDSSEDEEEEEEEEDEASSQSVILC